MESGFAEAVACPAGSVRGGMRGWGLGSGVGSGSVLALPSWPCGGDRLGTPGEGWARRQQEGQVVRQQVGRGFPASHGVREGQGTDQEFAGSWVPTWLPELATVLGRADVCPRSGIAAPAQESTKSKCWPERSAPTLQAWSVLLWASAWTSVCALWSRSQRMRPAGLHWSAKHCYARLLWLPPP